MNKADLIKAVAKKAGITQAESKVVVDSVFDVIKDTLSAGDPVSILGFGTFTVNERPAREGFNPITKQMMTIEAKRSVKFKPSETLL